MLSLHTIMVIFMSIMVIEILSIILFIILLFRLIKDKHKERRVWEELKNKLP